MKDNEHARKQRFAMAAALYLLVLASSVAWADDHGGSERDDDSEIVYQGLKTGRFISLATVLAKLKLPKGSEIVNIALEEEQGIPVYEILYVDPGGRRREIRADARNGDLVDELRD